MKNTKVGVSSVIYDQCLIERYILKRNDSISFDIFFAYGMHIPYMIVKLLHGCRSSLNLSLGCQFPSMYYLPFLDSGDNKTIFSKTSCRQVGDKYWFS